MQCFSKEYMLAALCFCTTLFKIEGWIIVDLLFFQELGLVLA